MGLKGTIAGRRDAEDAELPPMPSFSKGADLPAPPGVFGDGAGDIPFDPELPQRECETMAKASIPNEQFVKPHRLLRTRGLG